MLKYKVAFTITGETLFSLLAKIVPLEDLKIQEIPDVEGEAIQAQLKEFGKLVQTPTHRPYKRHTKRQPSHLFNPNVGINKIILDSLISGPRTANDIRPLLTEGGYSPNSAGSRLQKLQQRNLVIQHGDGLWSLANQRLASDHREQQNAT